MVKFAPLGVCVLIACTVDSVLPDRASAQSLGNAGTIEGTVVDQSGAVTTTYVGTSGADSIARFLAAMGK